MGRKYNPDRLRLALRFLEKMKNFLFLLISSALLLEACRKDTKIDVVSPVVTQVRVEGFDSTAIQVEAGATLNVSIAVTDNDRLNEVLVVVHDAENGHVHEGEGHLGGEFRLNTGTWAKQDVLQADNTAASFDLQLEVPDSIAGNWHLVVTAMDQLGNLSSEYVVLLNIVNDELPVISGATLPAAGASGVVYVGEGNTLLLDGTASDPDGLAEVKAYSVNTLGQIAEITFIAMLGNPTSLSFVGVSFDQAVVGSYRIVVEATDLLGNQRLWDTRVIVQ